MAKRKKKREATISEKRRLMATPIQIEDETVRDILTRAREHFGKVGKHPDELKVLALTLRSANYSYPQIATIIGVGRTTVMDWVNRPTYDNVGLSELATGIKERMASKLYVNSNQIFNAAMDDDKIDKASHLQLVTSGSIMIDKARLMEGKSTENISMMYQRSDNFDDRKQEITNEILDIEGEIITLETDNL